MDLSQILLNAQSADSQLRGVAEAQLQSAEQQNMPAFLVALSAELASEEKNPLSRKLAGLILKNALTATDEDLQEQKAKNWLALDLQLRNTVKTNILNALSSKTEEASSTAAQVIAAIAAIEMPEGGWDDLLPLLVAPLLQEDEAKKIACLKAISYICDATDPDALLRFSNQILTGIVQCTRAEETSTAVRLAGINALLNTLVLVGPNFEREDEKNYIMQVVCTATQASDTRIAAIAFECLVKIAGLYYAHITSWMQYIFDITIKAIRSEDEDVAQQAVEFWSTICDVEIDILLEIEECASMGIKPERSCQNFIKGAIKFLAPVLTEALTRQESEEQDEDTWNVSTAAGTCLSLIANTVYDEVVPEIMPFVQKHIQDQNWRLREAAVLAFGSILEGPTGYLITELVTQAVPLLLIHMGDQVTLVKDTAAWTLGRICQLHSGCLTDKLSDVMKVFLHCLEDEPRIASKICWAIHNLAESFEEASDKPSSPLSQYFKALVEALLKATERDDADESFLRASAYEALNLLIQNAANDCRDPTKQLVPVFLDRLEKAFNFQIVSADDKEAQNELLGHLCGALQACTQKLEADIKPFADKMMTLFLRVFETQNATVHEEALMAVGAIANAVEVDFVRYMPAFHKWLEFALRNWEEHQVCTVAVGVVGDICRAIQEKVQPYCDVIVTLLLDNLRNPNINRSVKPPILSCFGDIAIAISGGFDKYLSIVMNMLQQASATEATDPSDYDFVDYVNQLREDIFEAYTAIIQGLRTDNKGDLFLPYVEHLVGFVSHVWQDTTKTEAVTRGAVGVLGDLAHALGPKVKNYLQHEIVQGIVNESCNSQSSQTREVAKWAKQIIAKIN
ncbi:Importin subunit beta-1 [Balamuthia mandrillaris]